MILPTPLPAAIPAPAPFTGTFVRLETRDNIARPVDTNTGYYHPRPAFAYFDGNVTIWTYPYTASEWAVILERNRQAQAQ